MEGNGTGMLLIVRECEEKGLAQPIFHPSFDYPKTILFRPTASARVEVRRTHVDEDEQAILALLDRYGELSTRQLSQ